MRRLLIIAALAAAACTTMSAVSRLQDRFLSFGMEPRMAACLVGELDEDLTGQELGAVADFLERFEDTDRRRPGAAIDAIMSMDNPEIVASVAAAGIACAFRR